MQIAILINTSRSEPRDKVKSRFWIFAEDLSLHTSTHSIDLFSLHIETTFKSI